MATAVTPSDQELKHNAIGLLQSTVIGIAASAPGQATALSLAAIITASMYGGGAVTILCGIPMLAIAYCYYRLNLWDQNCGATYMWVGRAINPYLGFMVGWIMLAGFALGEVSNILPLGPAFLSLVGADPNSQWGTVISATVLSGIVMLLAVLGIQLTARFQLLIAGVEYVILTVLAIIAIVKVFFQHAVGTVHPTAAWFSPTGVGGKGELVAGLLVAVYLFTGWDTSIYLNEETEQKEVNPGKAVIYAVIALTIFYALLVVAFQGVASMSKMEAHGADALVYAGNVVVGPNWGKFMAIAVCLSIVGTTQAILIATARIAFSMGRDHVLPSVFGRITPRFQTPAFGTMFFGVLVLIAMWLYIFSSSVASAFDTVLTLVGILFALFYTFTGIATIWYYRRLVTRSAGDIFFLGVAPIVGAGILLYVAVESMIGLSGQALWSMVLVGIAGIVMLVIARVVFHAPFFGLRAETYQPEAPAAAPTPTTVG